MLSIRNTMTELERLAAERDTAVDCYRDALQNVADYAVELDEQVTSQHRRHVAALAAGLCSTVESLREAGATLRALLRDYRNRAAEYLNNIRDQLASTARALEEVMESLAQTDGDHEARIRAALHSLRDAAQHSAAAPVREVLLSAANAIDSGVEEMRKQHQSHVAQFMTEIHVLHNRIGQLESAGSIDSVTKLMTRGEIEKCVRNLGPGNVSLVLMAISGLRLAEVRYSGDVAAQLAGAFTKRLRNIVPPTAVIGRWSAEEFVAILDVPVAEAIKAAKAVGEQLSGMYSCLQGGKVVRPDLQVRVMVVERTEGSPERLLGRVREFMTQSMAPPAA
jgi:GGDEF domain-containing protein/ElaB/YqjD/DUF883 family membrane-anchored ribosome-binding protein